MWLSIITAAGAVGARADGPGFRGTSGSEDLADASCSRWQGGRQRAFAGRRSSGFADRCGPDDVVRSAERWPCVTDHCAFVSSRDQWPGAIEDSLPWRPLTTPEGCERIPGVTRS